MTAADHVSTAQFGFRPQPDNGFPERGQTRGVTRRVPADPSRYTTNQQMMDPATVDHYVRRGLSRNQGGSANSVDPIYIVKHGGHEQVWGGHHRMAAAHLRGQKTVTAKYHDVDEQRRLYPEQFPDRRT